MIDSDEFVPTEEKETVELIKITPREMGLTDYPTTAQIYVKAQEMGFELCPPEVGITLRLSYTDQPLGEWFRIGMKQITDSGGYPDVFDLERSDDGLWLNDLWAKPDRTWSPGYEWCFRLRKSPGSSNTSRDLDTLNLETRIERLEKIIKNIREILSV